MKKIIALLVLSATLGSAHAAAGCPATEQNLLGGWSQNDGSGFFEEFSLETEAGTRAFNSWLHQRPDLLDATWKLENCQLIVEPQDDELGTFRFNILGLKRGKLRLYDESDHIESVYVRVPNEP